MTERTIYKQLRPEERMVISSMKLRGASTRAMAEWHLLWPLSHCDRA